MKSPNQGRKYYRRSSHGLSSDFVDRAIIRSALAEPDAYQIAGLHWQHGLTEDEAMIVIYRLGYQVYEGTRLCAALDRHRKRLPLWRRFIHPERLEPVDLSDISPAARQALNKIGIDQPRGDRQGSPTTPHKEKING
jgi:hypothetical protein